MLLARLRFLWHYLSAAYRSQVGKLSTGQGLVEYALILVLVAVAVIVVLTLLGPSIGNMFSNIMCNVWDAQGRFDC